MELQPEVGPGLLPGLMGRAFAALKLVDERRRVGAASVVGHTVLTAGCNGMQPASCACKLISCVQACDSTQCKQMHVTAALEQRQSLPKELVPVQPATQLA